MDSDPPVRPAHVQAEIDGMRAVPHSGAEPWVTRLKPPHPVHVARVAGALITVTGSLTQAYMVAYTLDDAGLLAAPADDEVALARVRAGIETELHAYAPDGPEQWYVDDHCTDCNTSILLDVVASAALAAVREGER